MAGPGYPHRRSRSFRSTGSSDRVDMPRRTTCSPQQTVESAFSTVRMLVLIRLPQKHAQDEAWPLRDYRSPSRVWFSTNGVRSGRRSPADGSVVGTLVDTQSPHRKSRGGSLLPFLRQHRPPSRQPLSHAVIRQCRRDRVLQETTRRTTYRLLCRDPDPERGAGPGGQSQVLQQAVATHAAGDGGLDPIWRDAVSDSIQE